MRLTEFLIIYLACGAPIGVYYFLQNRLSTGTARLWLKTVLVFIFWIPFAISFTRTRKVVKTDFYKASAVEIESEKNIFLLQKRIEKISLESRSAISLFELRETLERYVGLTFASQIKEAEISKREREIFRVSKTENVELAAVCLNRRNRQRLSLHQTAARRDFLRLVETLLDSSASRKNLELAAIEFVKILKDFAAQTSLEKIFALDSQTSQTPGVEQTENDLWKPETYKPPNAKPSLTHLQAMPAATLSRRKD